MCLQICGWGVGRGGTQVSEGNRKEDEKKETENTNRPVNGTALISPPKVKVNGSTYALVPSLEANDTGNITSKYDYFVFIYHEVLMCLLVYVIPLAVLFTLNILLIIALRKFHARHSQMTNQGDTSNMAVTLNIIVLVGLFLVCQTPEFVFVVIMWEDVMQVDLVFWLYYIKTILRTFNTSVNFLIYCFFYKEFRQKLVNMICRH